MDSTRNFDRATCLRSFGVGAGCASLVLLAAMSTGCSRSNAQAAPQPAQPAQAAPGQPTMPAAMGATGAVPAVAGGLNPAANPNFGALPLRPGFVPDPATRQVVAGGGLHAAAASPTCAGYVSAAPDLVLDLGGTSSWMRIYAQSEADTTLVVRRPDGTFMCNDDAYGTNPAVEGAFPAGRYAIWVGSYQAGQTANATVAFTELQSQHP